MEINRNENITVNDVAQVISVEKQNNNVQRQSLIISNQSLGGQIITIAIGSEAVAGAGIVLGVGSSWADTADGAYKPTQSQITAISSAAGGVIALQERVMR